MLRYMSTMTSLTDLLQQGATHAWLFVPTAILLGALHGLEPGHSKTMMAAFIIAVRGTVRQAVLLGLAATASHTVVVWIVALGGMWLFGGLKVETTEPYFQLASGIMIIAIAVWMLWRTRREQHAVNHDHEHHDHDHDHDHDHGHDHHHLQKHSVVVTRGLEVATGGYADAHELAHADTIRRRFADRNVTTGQIVLFGLTGGLIPCPASVTVLLLCLQLRQFTLGAVLVLCFSIGLAITLVTVGAAAALSVRHATKRFSWFSTVARRAPYFSSVLIICVGLYVGYQGWAGLVR